jgi:hypothetical protein
MLGPYYTALPYYSNLLHISWLNWMEEQFTYEDRETLKDRFKVCYYLLRVLHSYNGSEKVLERSRNLAT